MGADGKRPYRINWAFLLTSLAGAVCGLMLSACAVDVKPWQKGNLAKTQMAFDPDPLEARFQQQVHKAKEGTHGGYGVGGGGCGCGR